MNKQRGIGFFSLLCLIVLIGCCVAFAWYLFHLDQIIRKKFEGQRWDIPAKIYARPLEVKRENRLTEEDLLTELKLLNYKQNNDVSKSGTYTYQDGALLIHTRGFDFGDRAEAEQYLAIKIENNVITSVKSNKPSPTGKTYLEPLLIGGIYPQHNEDRVLIKLDKTPKTLIAALIATEDRNFYEHYGISIRGTSRAIVSNITGGRRQGGSTLTQQLVKNFYLSSEKTYKRKAVEALMAMLLEVHYSKDEILEAYLNEVNLGQNGNYSINGYGLASQFYFGRPLKELNIAQHAFLAGLVQGPSLYNPWKNPQKAIQRRNLVLQNMWQQGYISEQQFQTEKKRPLGVLAKPTLSAARFPDFMDVVRRQLRSDYVIEDLEKQGLKVFTTLDPIAQMKAERAFKAATQRLSDSKDPLQGAALISNPQNGELLVAIGSTQNFTGFNRALDAKRQVGSLLKPVIYLNALESERYTWASIIQDRAIEVPIDASSTWKPKNYAGGEYGAVPMVKALANSYNLSAVQVGTAFPLENFSNRLYQLGVPRSTQIPNYPSILLGAVNLTPMDMLAIYQTIAMGGEKRTPRAIRSVINQDGHIIERVTPHTERAIQPTYAYLLNYGLQQVVKSGTAKALNQSFNPALNIAGKTGTTNEGRDAWFAGYTGNHVAVVWIGYDDNRVTRFTGGTGALPVWASVMKQLHQTPVQYATPQTVSWQWISNGKRSNEQCGGIRIPMSEQSIPYQATECAGGDQYSSHDRGGNPYVNAHSEPDSVDLSQQYHDEANTTLSESETSSQDSLLEQEMSHTPLATEPLPPPSDEPRSVQ
ncbi:MAG: penicillin-binding protein 1B [Acinetobacter sp.]|nr:penicillin-binding protein 1B [Acinetobacter sp.]